MRRLAVGLTVALVGVGCGGDELDAQGATEAAQEFFGYIADEDAENFCASVTDNSLTGIYGGGYVGALSRCLSAPPFNDDELVTRAELLRDEEPTDVDLDGIRAVVEFAPNRRPVRLFYRENSEAWLVELVP